MIDRCSLPGPGEVRVRVAVSGVNPTDWKTRSGASGTVPDGWQIPNQDGAGTIDAVGDGVDEGRVGQRVWVWFAATGQRWGTAAEWTVVPSAGAVPLPDDVDFGPVAPVTVRRRSQLPLRPRLASSRSWRGPGQPAMQRRPQ